MPRGDHCWMSVACLARAVNGGVSTERQPPIAHHRVLSEPGGCLVVALPAPLACLCGLVDNPVSCGDGGCGDVVSVLRNSACGGGLWRDGGRGDSSPCRRFSRSFVAVLCRGASWVNADCSSATRSWETKQHEGSRHTHSPTHTHSHRQPQTHTQTHTDTRATHLGFVRVELG